MKQVLMQLHLILEVKKKIWLEYWVSSASVGTFSYTIFSTHLKQLFFGNIGDRCIFCPNHRLTLLSFKNSLNPLFVHVGTYSLHWESRQGGEGILICNREEKMRRKISCCCSGFSCSKICGLASWSARTFLLMSHHCRAAGMLKSLWVKFSPPLLKYD